MNREIKFRAFNKERKQFIYSDWKYGVPSFWETVSNDFTGEYHEAVQQYTGLKDKNGKEIYEGDIVKDAAPWSWVVRFGECKYDGQTFVGWYMEHPEREDFSGPFSEEDCAVLEVIGNIYEAPELFKHGI